MFVFIVFVVVFVFVFRLFGGRGLPSDAFKFNAVMSGINGTSTFPLVYLYSSKVVIPCTKIYDHRHRDKVTLLVMCRAINHERFSSFCDGTHFSIEFTFSMDKGLKSSWQEVKRKTKRWRLEAVANKYLSKTKHKM